MVFLATVLLLVAGGLYLYSNPPVAVVSPQPPMAVPPQTYISGPSEKGKVFRVSSSGDGPRLVSGFVDAYNPSVGENQVFSVYVVDQAPVQPIIVAIKTDTKTSIYELQLVKGTDMDGHWQGSWTVADTHSSIHQIKITARGANGTTEVDLTLK